MLTVCVSARRRATLIIMPLLLAALILMSLPVSAFAQPAAAGGEANLVLPDLAQATFLGGTNGRTLLMWGCWCALWAPVRVCYVYATAQSSGAQVDAGDLGADLRDLQDVSHHAGQILLLLWVFIAVIIAAYFWLASAYAG